MLPFVLYLLTGCATATQLLSFVLFFVWGRQVSPLEIVTLSGSATLIGMALYSLFRPKRAAWGAFVASAVMLSYYGFAVYAAIRNITLFSSEYRIQLFVPPALLFATFAYSLVAAKKTGAAALPSRGRWTALPLGIVVIGLSPFVSIARPVADSFFEPRKVVTVLMSWTRGDNVYGPNFVHLESSCPNSADSRCFCGVDFRITNSGEFADYIQSFDNRKVPVRYEVFYDRDGQPSSADLKSVGNWSREKFHENEQSISAGARDIRPGDKAVTSRTPQDCFAPLQMRH